MKPLVLNAAGAIALTFTVAACVSKPDSARPPAAAQPRPAPPSKPASPPTPAHTSWMDAPATPGDWTYTAQPGGGTAQFVDAQSGARFSLSCDRASGRISLIRSGQASTAVPMTIRTEFGDRAFTASPVENPASQLVATVPANDSFLDAMALSKGRFSVEIMGLSTLYLPSWSEATRAIEDCR